MALPDPPDTTLAEQVRAAFARDPRLHELGIQVTVLSAQRRAALAGVVATAERRTLAGEIARRALPGFEIRNDVSVQQLAPPEPESLA